MSAQCAVDEVEMKRTSQPKRAVSALQARTATIEVADRRYDYFQADMFRSRSLNVNGGGDSSTRPLCGLGQNDNVNVWDHSKDDGVIPPPFFSFKF